MMSGWWSGVFGGGRGFSSYHSIRTGRWDLWQDDDGTWDCWTGFSLGMVLDIYFPVWIRQEKSVLSGIKRTCWCIQA